MKRKSKVFHAPMPRKILFTVNEEIATKKYCLQLANFPGMETDEIVKRAEKFYSFIFNK